MADDRPAYESWMTQVADDGRVFEFVSAEWAPSLPEDPPATVASLVTATIDGVLVQHRTVWDSEKLEAAYRAGGNCD